MEGRPGATSGGDHGGSRTVAVRASPLLRMATTGRGKREEHEGRERSVGEKPRIRCWAVENCYWVNI